jgi:hydroxyquinol 1,2-dioxygenase
MREFDEATITDAVLERVANTPDPRARQISQALVRHLHAFIREIEPTQAEWEWGIRFLTETGQLCSDTRQEFILLSDTLGVSMLVDAINHRLPSGANRENLARWPPGAMRRRSHSVQADADRTGLLRDLSQPSFDAFRQQAHVRPQCESGLNWC